MRRRGFLATIRLAVLDARRRSHAPLRFIAELWFDLVNGVDTRGVVRHQGGPDAYAHAEAYQAVTRSTFLDAMAHPAVPHGEQYVFVDLGCGKGKALLLASRYGFKRLIGLELSPELVVVGRRNVERFAGRRRGLPAIEIMCGDAAGYEPPEEPLLVYLHNPFDDVILQAVVRRLGASVNAKPRPMFLLYHNPVHRAVLEGVDLIAASETVAGGILYRFDSSALHRPSTR